MSNFVSKPNITLNMIPRGGENGIEDHRVLLVGQITDGTASAGLVQDVPRTNAEINALFGAQSHLALVARGFRKVNKYTSVDAIALADASGTAATAKLVFVADATEDGTLYIDVVSATDHSYTVSVEEGDDEAAIMAKLLPLVTADTSAPFDGGKSTTTNTDDTITFTAQNDGTIPNSWGLRVRGSVAGVSVTVTGWASGATDPTIAAALFDPVANIRYQGIVWPKAYSTSVLKTWIDARKNVDNDIKDGVACYYMSDTLANAKTEALTQNSSEIVILWNEPNSSSLIKGPHICEAPDVIAAQFMATRALRFENLANLNRVVTATEPRDQFGGTHTATLPYFNSIFPSLSQPVRGTGATLAEQAEARGGGVAVIGANRQNNAVITGTIVTTYQNDAAGNEDDTWQFLNWRDTHSVIREYYVTNYKKKFAQYRLTSGDLVPGYAVANEALLRSYAMRLYKQLSEGAITVAGRDAERYFRENLSIIVTPETRSVSFAGDFPILSQFEIMTGTVKFSFSTT